MCHNIRNEEYHGLVGSGTGMYGSSHRILCLFLRKEREKEMILFLKEMLFLHGYFAKNKV